MKLNNQNIHTGKLPIRSVILGPSGSGKTVLLSNLILDVYKGCFSRVYIFSPSIEVDYTWVPVKEHIEKEMKVKHTKEEPIYFDHYDAEALSDIIDTQHKIIDYEKNKVIKNFIRYWLSLMILQMIHPLQEVVNYYMLYMLEVAIT